MQYKLKTLQTTTPKRLLNETIQLQLGTIAAW